MIINKSKIFCSFIRKSMFNLEEFEFSNVSKSVSNPVSSNKPKNIKIIENQVKQERQGSTKQTSVQNRKLKSIRTIPDPIKTDEIIHEWRKTHIAAVDTIGCQRLSETHLSEQVQKYQTLISLMLSVQTTDQITFKTVKRLQQHGLTPENIAQTSESQLIELIYEANFNKRKAKNIIQVSKLVIQNGLPKNKQDLLKLPGIGIKIAMIYLRVAEGVQEGIGVDTHVHRISNKLGWVQTSNPNQTEKQLQALFPKKYWTHLNIDLVGFGQILCNAKKPLCSECPVKLLCPSSLVKQNTLQW